MAEAKKEPAPAAAKGAAPKKRGGMAGFIILMTALGAAVPFILPSLVLLVGMVPTVVALIADNDRQKSSAMTVGTMNAAGVTPFIIELWHKGQTMENALGILREPHNWLVMLGAAALGQLILLVVPQAIASLALARAEARLVTLKQNLETLKATWGADVGTAKPFSKVARGE